MANLTDRDRFFLMSFVSDKANQLANSKPDFIVDYLDLTNPDIVKFLGNKVVLSQAAIDSLEANKISANDALTKDIADLTSLTQKLGPSK